jgi:hypothetical protein
MSPQTKEALEKYGTFNIELRGPVEMKVNKQMKQSGHAVLVTNKFVGNIKNLYFQYFLLGQGRHNHLLAPWREWQNHR